MYNDKDWLKNNFFVMCVWKKIYCQINPRTYTQIHSPTIIQEGGSLRDGWNPSPDFLILVCCSILKRFYLKWKAFDLLNKIRHVLWVVVLLEAFDVINNNGQHLGHHLRFYQELEIGLKLQEMVIFCALHEK